jgi:hypothetical protein
MFAILHALRMFVADLFKSRTRAVKKEAVMKRILLAVSALAIAGAAAPTSANASQGAYG